MMTPPTPEERIWAVLSHLSALAFGMGILLPVLGWSQQRGKSRYASFQCLQALGYQSLGYTIWLLTSLLVIVILFTILLANLGMQESPVTDPQLLAGGWTALLIGTMLGLFGVFMILPVVGATACALGKDFRYPILGNRLARYLGDDPIDVQVTPGRIEDHEDRWVAAMGHFAVIILLWGILVPLTAWVLEGKRSLFLKVQSTQAIVYQAAAHLLYLVAGGIYLFGFLIFMILFGFEGGSVDNSSRAMLGMIVFLVSMLAAALIVLIVPLLHILGQWAGYRVLKGSDYRYPLVGRPVERFVAKS